MPIGNFLTPRRGRNFLFLLASLMLLAGCRKKENNPPLPPARVHTITREMMHAAGSEIRERGGIESKLEFDALHERADGMRISLHPGASAQARNESLARLVQSLDRIATANGLARGAGQATGNLTHLEYRHAGVLTHSIEIAVRTEAETAPGPAPPISRRKPIAVAIK